MSELYTIKLDYATIIYGSQRLIFTQQSADPQRRSAPDDEWSCDGYGGWVAMGGIDTSLAILDPTCSYKRIIC